MKYNLFSIITAIMFSTTTMAQTLKMPTLEDLIPGGETYRYAESMYGLQWWGDTAIKPEIDSLFAIDPATGEETLLFTRQKMNIALEAAGIKPISSLYNVSFPWPGDTQVLLIGEIGGVKFKGRLASAMNFQQEEWQTLIITLIATT